MEKAANGMIPFAKPIPNGMMNCIKSSMIRFYIMNQSDYTEANKMTYEVLDFTCTGLTDGGVFPIEYTGRGMDNSPEFTINNLSSRAVTLLLILEDLSHPIKGFTHWIIWDIPAANKIPKAIPPGKTIPSLSGAVQGIGYGFHRYAGPKPPRGTSHQYCFSIYSLDCRLNLKASTTKRNVLRRADGHILQRGCLYGYFE